MLIRTFRTTRITEGAVAWQALYLMAVGAYRHDNHKPRGS